MAKKRTKRQQKTVKNIGKILLAVGILTCFAIVISLGSFVIDAYGFDITNYKMDSSSVVFGVDKNGNPLEYEQLHGDTRRVWVDIENIPDFVQKAAISIEDERFYSHRGIDIKRTAGAILGFITGTSDYGGSTITQQLVKNVTGDWDNSPTRKIREIFRALVVETKMNKEEILEYYLNIVYFGNGSNGVQMAAYTYFDKDIADLTVAEAAAIVGITQSPRNLDPFEYPENNKNRQMLVLGKMKELGYLNEEEYNEAAAQPLEFKQTSIAQKNGVNTWFAEALVEEVTNDLAAKQNIPLEQATRMVYSGGLKIYSTMNVDVQNAMHKTFEDSENTKLFPKLSGDVQPQASMVIISPEDGAIRGMVGGVGPKTESLILNRATDTYRQPGSSIKPLAVYGPAVELNLISPGSIIIDEPFSQNGWNPRNWYSGYEGPVTMRRAVERSMNIPAIKTLMQVGVDASYDFLVNKMHFSNITAKDDKYLAPLSLGGLTKGVSVKEMAAAYAVFANKGMYTKPYMYTKVLDKTGKVILEKEIVNNRVFSEQTADIMTSVLVTTAEGGLGISAKLNNMTAAGKTGTTNDDKDRWYVGYTPYYVGAVWYGYDDPKTVPYSQTSIVAHKLFKSVMNDVHAGLPNKGFKSPSGVSWATICLETGDLATESCEKTAYEMFKPNMVPLKECSGVHVPEGENPEETDPNATPDPNASPDPNATTEPTPTPETTPRPQHTPIPISPAA